MRKIILIVVVAVVVFSCQRNPLKIDVSSLDVNFRFESFEDDLFMLKDSVDEKISSIENKYPEFLPIFTYQMIQIGGSEDSGFVDQLESFINDTLVANLKERADLVINKDQLKTDLSDAFRYYHHHFPEKLVPAIYTCISGFNQSIVMTDSLIGISLDKYLGADCVYYSQLGIANYKVKNMTPQKIVPDAIYAWGMTEFPFDESKTHLIDHMVYEGKLLYFMDAILPELTDSLKIGFSQDQLNFCESSEEAMWTYLAENNLLFSSDRMDIKRYVDDAPYTSSFTSNSPGRTGAWLGWQIVRAYMSKNNRVSLGQLMLNDDYQSILNDSGYRPDK